MRPLKLTLLLSASPLVAALLLAPPASAQVAPTVAPTIPAGEDDAEPAQEASTVEEIVVTGSRVQRNGYSAPTPLTVMSAEALTASAPRVQDALLQLPSLRGGGGPSATSVAQAGAATTAYFVSLRGLGPQRTLVLLDGRRLTPANASGAADTALLPTALLSRVEIVTGGASAIYGSDAVAGVVNYVLDTTYEGFKGEIRSGISDQSDQKSWGAEIAGGHSFFGDRAHIIYSGSYQDSSGVGPYDRDWNTAGWAVLSIPGNNPTQIVSDRVGQIIGTTGGLITSPGALANLMFLPGGGTAPFNNPGSPVSSVLGVNGDGLYYPSQIVAPNHSADLFAHLTYHFNDRVEGFVEGSWGASKARYRGSALQATGAGAYTIFSDNAYLPTEIRQRMAQLGVTSFRLARFGSEDVGSAYAENANEAYSVVAGFKARLGGSWTLDGYAEHGENKLDSFLFDQAIRTAVYDAADAVINPATGAIVCRTTLLNPSHSCVPMNLFGVGAPSAESIDFITGDSSASATNKLDVVSASIRGEPFTLPAGPVSFAAGAEYRRVSTDQVSDPISQTVVNGSYIRGFPASLQNQLGGFTGGNLQPVTGSYDVTEAFAETVVPILSEVPFARLLEFNGAYRYTDYSRSGVVNSWKVGLSYEPIDGVRLRATRSRDIRAPNIAELFAGAVVTTGVVNDPNFGGQSVSNVITRLVGNPDVIPEISDTTALGVVLRPTWLPGAGLSIDAFNIEIENAITNLGGQRILDQCAAGATALCSLILRGPDGRLFSIDNPNLNAASLSVKGVDFEGSYRTKLFGGDLSLRALATYISDRTTVLQGAAAVNRAGEIGDPKWQANASVTFSRGPLTLTAQQRYIGSTVRDVTYGPADININKIDPAYYTDLNLRYRLPGNQDRYEVFAGVNNLFNRDPSITANGGPAGTIFRLPTVGTLYDVVGRYYSAGLRFTF